MARRSRGRPGPQSAPPVAPDPGPRRPRSQSDYFVATRGDFVLTPSRWNLKYEQPDGWYLVTTVNEFLTYCAQMRPGVDPHLVLSELVNNGAITEAPESFIGEAVANGVLVRQDSVFRVVE